jgi:NAD(P)H-flavin reductase/ferredoxin
MGTSYEVIVEPTGQRVTCRDDQPILDACLRAGVWLPHACTHGTCGTCKAAVVDGDIDHGEASPFALLEFERNEGAALLCCARPRSDVVIEADVDEIEGVEVHPVRDFTGEVAAIDFATPDVGRLTIELDADLAFNAGQYVLLSVRNSGENRPYSLANPPSERRRIELHIRRLPGGRCSDGWVFTDLRPGERVRLSGPYGRFSFRPAVTKPVLLLAGGTGLAPIESIARHIVETRLDVDLTIYHGVRTAADLYDLAAVRALEAAAPERVRFRPAVSREEFEGRQGRVPDLVLADFERCAGHVAYVCGSPGFVDDCIKALMKRRLFPRDIFREDFFDATQTEGSGIRSPLLRR